MCCTRFRARFSRIQKNIGIQADKLSLSEHVINMSKIESRTCKLCDSDKLNYKIAWYTCSSPSGINFEAPTKYEETWNIKANNLITVMCSIQYSTRCSCTHLSDDKMGHWNYTNHDSIIWSDCIPHTVKNIIAVSNTRSSSCRAIYHSGCGVVQLHTKFLSITTARQNWWPYAQMHNVKRIRLISLCSMFKLHVHCTNRGCHHQMTSLIHFTFDSSIDDG